MTSDPVARPHPGTGQPFVSPVPPGTGWPGDPATPRTPVCRSTAEVSARAEAAADLGTIDALSSVCAACPRLVAWREEVAVTKRAAYADQPYWGRPAPSYGDPAPRLLIVGLAPAAHGANRTGRMFTGDRSGDWLYAALHRAGVANQPTSVAAGDGLRLTGVRLVATVRCAPPANRPTPVERGTCAPWLDRELALVERTLTGLLALGKIGWDATLGAVRRAGWTLADGSPIRATTAPFGHGAQVGLRTAHGKPVRLVGSYHVSQQNTFTGKLTREMLDAAIEAALGGGASLVPPPWPNWQRHAT